MFDLAERVGFEPTGPRKGPNGFRDRPIRPLWHLSAAYYKAGPGPVPPARLNVMSVTAQYPSAGRRAGKGQAPEVPHSAVMPSGRRALSPSEGARAGLPGKKLVKNVLSAVYIGHHNREDTVPDGESARALGGGRRS